MQNTATATGSTPDGKPNTSEPDSVTTPLDGAPGVKLLKQAGPVTDANGNGRSNYADYAAGVDPTAPPDPSVHPVAGFSEGAATWSHTRRTGALDVFVSYERSTDLEVFLPLVEGVDYEVLAIRPLSPIRELVEIRLLSVDPAAPQIFLRQITRSTPAP